MSDESELNRLRADLEVLERYEGRMYALAAAKAEIGNKIAELEAAADPWREAKEFAADHRKNIGRLGNVANFIIHLTAEVARLTARVAELESACDPEDDEDLAAYNAPPRKVIGKVEFRPIADMQPPFEGPIVGIEPVLDPDRVLRTALGLLESMFPLRSHTSPAQVAIDFVRKHTVSLAKPYPLKKGGE